jgi:hypothetical protein
MNYDRLESAMLFAASSDLEEKFPGAEIIESPEKDLIMAIADRSAGKTLWRLCLIFTLLFLGAEIFFLRFLR